MRRTSTALCAAALCLSAASGFLPATPGAAHARASASAQRRTPCLAKKKAAAAEATPDKDGRKEALEATMHSIERAYGRGAILKLGENTGMVIERTPSGALTLDAALGGGYPKGRVVEIYGPESSGKTTLALHAIAEAQKAGGYAAFVDAEHALDPQYASKLGVNVDELWCSQPDSGEMALDIVDQLVRSAAVDLVVVDSVAALVPRAELEGDMADTQMGLQARLMSKALRKITGSLSKSQCTVIFLNQLRSKIGVMYGSPEVTAGGNALKFYASVRIDVRRRDILRDNLGVTIRAKMVKNKVAPPFREVMLDILFGSGIDTYACVLDAADEVGVVERKGSWYQYDGVSVAQGKTNAIEYLKSNPDVYAEVSRRVRERFGEDPEEVAALAAAAEAAEGEMDEMDVSEVKLTEPDPAFHGDAGVVLPGGL